MITFPNWKFFFAKSTVSSDYCRVKDFLAKSTHGFIKTCSMSNCTVRDHEHGQRFHGGIGKLAHTNRHPSLFKAPKNCMVTSHHHRNILHQAITIRTILDFWPYPKSYTSKCWYSREGHTSKYRNFKFKNLSMQLELALCIRPFFFFNRVCDWQAHNYRNRRCHRHQNRPKDRVCIR